MLTAGTLLKKEREKQNLSLEEISASTKIQKHYLEALEKDQYSKFASTVYAKGFLRSYAKRLGLDEHKLLALFRRAVSEESTAEVKESKRPMKDMKLVITPSTVIISSIVILVITTLAYLFYQFYNFQRPPELEIYSPENNSTVETPEITIQGKTERDMFVTINDEAIRINDDGSFKISLTLTEGQNSIVIKSKHPDDIGKEAIATRTIEYVKSKDNTEEVAGEDTIQEEEPSTTSPSQEQEKEKTDDNIIHAVIEVINESTWIEIEIDGSPELTSIVQPDTTLEYDAKESIYIKSGKVTTTTVTLNEEETSLFVGESGVGSMICEFKNNNINCQQP
jgi:cytoskeletal protein RodZ